MSIINIQNIQFQNNPCPFQTPFKIDITFECLKSLKPNEELEWQLLYVGSSQSQQYDQVLDKFSISAVQQGIMAFTIEANPPDYTKIPSKDDLLGVTALILSVQFQRQEFFRAGYYVYNQYSDPSLIENDPENVIIQQIERNILTNQPRITHFNIKWNNECPQTNDCNTNEIIQQQMSNNGQIPIDLQKELQQLNYQMSQMLPDPFGQLNGNLIPNQSQQLLYQQVGNIY